ncbi:MAG: diacylglycerol kinase family protein [Myxococcota bacterium]
MSGKPRRPGVLLNANARGVRRDPSLRERLARTLPEAHVVATREAGDVLPAVSRLLDEGVDALLVVGGDGTWPGTLTPLLQNFDAESLPVIVPCRGGTVNTIARSFGIRTSPEDSLRALLAGKLEEAPRAVVRVVADGEAPRFGWIFVVGAGVRFLELYYQEPVLGPRAALAVVGRVASSALRGGRLASELFAPFETELCVDGDRIGQQRFTVIGAAGVREIGLGFAPFLTAGDDPERIHLTATDASAVRLSLELPALRSGWGPNSLSHFPMRESTLELTVPQTCTLDAELFAPARTFTVSAGPALRMALPRAGAPGVASWFPKETS